ncbi:protoheme IX farnesyltransferase [Raineyella antarctica]|uniref:Protoheme IX farnesyltransferase n=1 Tax=Raineyella antarctica TaxID=1577474 RepID=A0A1G6GDW1_9ACTN|nr:heme o synthase [Raineyella antarctica]SDB80202.1 protoheme IX farnesyltransferase [Raineyella antarctica]
MSDSRDGTSVAAPVRVTVADVVGAYVRLTKPRVIELLLITAVPAMFLAAHGLPRWQDVIVVLVGGYAAAGSANVFNNVYDRDIDEQMRRTRRRPMPRHEMSERAALVFGSVLGVVALVVLGWGGNLLSGALGLAAILFYVLIYTMLLKRRTAQNIVWGGIAGCFPPLIAWTVVTAQLAWAPLVMFLIVFFWTPPHTWALAFRYREDYASVDVPMLPVVRSAPAVANQILVYSVLTVATTLLLWAVAGTGPLYLVVAAVSGAAFLWEAFGLWRRAHAGLTDAALKPMRLFHWSNSYLALVFLALAVDPLLF